MTPNGPNRRLFFALQKRAVWLTGAQQNIHGTTSRKSCPRWAIGSPVDGHGRQPMRGGGDDEWARRPVSRVLCRPARVGAGRGGHSSGPALAGRFSRPTRTARTGDGPALPIPEQVRVEGRTIPIRSCSRRGLPCRPHRWVRGGLLPHPFTLTPLVRAGRFAFCGAVPRVAPGGRYPPPCRRGARTFLGRLVHTRARDRPAIWPAA